MGKKSYVEPVDESTLLSSPMFWKQEFDIGGEKLILEITEEDCEALEAKFKGFFKHEKC